MALPVIPQSPGIILEPRYYDSGGPEQPFRVAAVEARRIVDEAQNTVRQSEILHDRLADAASRGEGHEAVEQGARNQPEECGVDPYGHLRRMRRTGEDVDNIAHAPRIWVSQVEAATVLAIDMSQVVESGDHKVHRYKIDPAALETDAWHPGGQRFAQLLYELEEIIRAVDLIHLASAAVADDDARSVDSPGHPALVAHGFFRQMFAGEIGVIQVLRLREHVFAEHALIEAGCGDRTDMVEPPGSDRHGEAYRVARALDVRGHLRLRIGFKRIDRPEMKEMIDPVGQRRHSIVAQPQSGA